MRPAGLPRFAAMLMSFSMAFCGAPATMLTTYSETKVKEMLRRWPQAVSLDEADLPRFHELCCAGKQITSTPKWADYLWLDLADVTFSKPAPPIREELFLTDTRGDGSGVSFLSIGERFPELSTGFHKIAIEGDHIAGVIELKSVSADLSARLQKAHTTGRPWREAALRAFASHHQERLREAQKQIRDTQRLISCEDALGVVVLIDTKPTGIQPTAPVAYIQQTIQEINRIDVVVYLSNTSDGGSEMPILIRKNANELRTRRFSEYFGMLFGSVHLGEHGEILIFGDFQDVVGRVTMDDLARGAFSENWEVALEKGFASRVKITFPERSRFSPGF
jgi:hypothetical protein